MKTIGIPILFAILGGGFYFGAGNAPSAPAQEAKPAAAQNAPAPLIGPEARHKIFRQVLDARIARALRLTAVQREQLHAIRHKTADSLKAIRADAGLSADQKAEKIHQASQDARRQIHGVLTAEQEVKLHKIQKHLRKLRSLLES